MSNSNLYRDLHLLLNQLPRHSYPYQKEKTNGVYVFFESGELYQDMNRVVWVGTHLNQHRLFYRIDDHFGPNQRLSMLRKHIGRCLLIREGREDYLPSWNLGFMSKAARKKISGRFDWVLEGELEEQISEYLQRHFSFAIISGEPNYQKRKRLAAGIIAALSQSKERCSSEQWLGNLHNHPKIRDGKLWNFNYQQASALTQEELVDLHDAISSFTQQRHSFNE